MFAREDIEITVTGGRSADELAPLGKAMGPKVVTRSLEETLAAGAVLLAIAFAAFPDEGALARSHQGESGARAGGPATERLRALVFDALTATAPATSA